MSNVKTCMHIMNVLSCTKIVINMYTYYVQSVIHRNSLKKKTKENTQDVQALSCVHETYVRKEALEAK